MFLPGSPARLACLRLLLVVLMPAAAGAVEFRLATCNVGGNFVDYCGICDSNDPEGTAIREVLRRVDADVVCLQEIFSNDVSGSPSDLEALAEALGYDHIYEAPLSGAFDFTLRNVILSRYPFLSTEAIRSYPNAKEVTRNHAAVVVDVPGTANDPIVIGVHLKSGNGNEDEFRRAIEMRRINEYLDAKAYDGTENLFILGDFNLDLAGGNMSFTAEPDGLPQTFDLGDDIRAEFQQSPPVPLIHSEDPSFYFTTPSLNRLNCRKVNGDDATIDGSFRTIDHILVSDAVLSREFACEIYDSALETHPNAGLPKAGSPPAGGTSLLASDHWVVFGDFTLEESSPLSLTLDRSSVEETDSLGSVVLTVTLPEAPGPGESVVVDLSSDRPDEAVPGFSSVTFTSGVTTRFVPIAPQADGIPDGTQLVTFTASAPGYREATAVLSVTNTDPAEYLLAGPGMTVTEDFAGFSGGIDPPRWTSAGGGPWRGGDEGASPAEGKYAYGAPAEPAPGLIPGDTPATFTATFVNASALPLTSLRIDYAAEHWRGSAGGTADRIEVALVVDGVTLPLPSLDFTAPTDRNGAIADGAPTFLSAVATDLWIAPGESFGIAWTFTRGQGGTSQSSDVFLNEFHYDNDGTDTNEFLEVIVGPGFSGNLAEIDVVLYNGADGAPYGTIGLGTGFDLGGTVDGYRIFSAGLPSNGIQNGPADGIAIVNTAGSGDVLQFLSYEGVMTAGSGPAAGLSSIDIGVVESGSSSPQDALGLTGSGAEAADFTWTSISGNASRGSLNPGQSLATPVSSQGLALDDVAVTVLADTDLDGSPDLLDSDDDGDQLDDVVELTLGTSPVLVDSDGDGVPDGEEDADGDGQTNAAEVIVLATDPLDGAERFEIALVDEGGWSLEFATLVGRRYRIEQSPDLEEWSTHSVHEGTGGRLSVPVAVSGNGSAGAFRVVVTLTAP